MPAHGPPIKYEHLQRDSPQRFDYFRSLINAVRDEYLRTSSLERIDWQVVRQALTAFPADIDHGMDSKMRFKNYLQRRFNEDYRKVENRRIAKSRFPFYQDMLFLKQPAQNLPNRQPQAAQLVPNGGPNIIQAVHERARHHAQQNTPVQGPRNPHQNRAARARPGIANQPGGQRGQTTLKHDEFIQRPLTDQDVTRIPGVGKVSRDLFLNQGINKAYQLFGQFLVLNLDEARFVQWLTQIVKIRNDHAQNIYKALSEWSDVHIPGWFR